MSGAGAGHLQESTNTEKPGLEKAAVSRATAYESVC